VTQMYYLLQMVPMMEKIALEMCERVSRVIDVRSLFQSPASMIKMRALEAVEMMNLWKSTYYEIRARIEATGNNARWEFDRRRLFDKTNYIAGVCKDLAGVAQASSIVIRGCPYGFSPYRRGNTRSDTGGLSMQDRRDD
jgi:hypothetical protein